MTLLLLLACDPWKGVETHSYPLTDAHALECAACHGDQSWDGLSPDCASCHSAPEGHFSGACDNCHRPTTWPDAEFRHNRFPIPHRGTDECAACHVNDDGYETFSCLDGCHAKDRTDNQHRGETNAYVYESEACYGCHPDGRE